MRVGVRFWQHVDNVGGREPSVVRGSPSNTTIPGFGSLLGLGKEITDAVIYQMTDPHHTEAVRKPDRMRKERVAHKMGARRVT